MSNALYVLLSQEQGFERRLRRFYELTRQRYLAASSRSERIVTPAGTGHNFPYETPGFATSNAGCATRPPAHHLRPDSAAGVRTGTGCTDSRLRKERACCVVH